jgi:hypothetical protein
MDALQRQVSSDNQLHDMRVQQEQRSTIFGNSEESRPIAPAPVDLSDPVQRQVHGDGQLHDARLRQEQHSSISFGAEAVQDALLNAEGKWRAACHDHAWDPRERAAAHPGAVDGEAQWKAACHNHVWDPREGVSRKREIGTPTGGNEWLTDGAGGPAADDEVAERWMGQLRGGAEAQLDTKLPPGECAWGDAPPPVPRKAPAKRPPTKKDANKEASRPPHGASPGELSMAQHGTAWHSMAQHGTA